MGTFTDIFRYRDATVVTQPAVVGSFNKVISAFTGCGMVACTPAESAGDVGAFVVSGAVSPDVSPVEPISTGSYQVGYKTFKLNDSYATTDPLYVRVYFYWVWRSGSSYISLRYAASKSLTFTAPFATVPSGTFLDYNGGTTTTTALPTTYVPIFAATGEGYFWISIAAPHAASTSSSYYSYIPDGLGSSFCVMRAVDSNEQVVTNEALTVQPNYCDVFSDGWAVDSRTGSTGVRTSRFDGYSWDTVRNGGIGLVHPTDFTINGKTRLARPFFFVGSQVRRYKMLVANRLLARDQDIVELPFNGVIRQFRHMRSFGTAEYVVARRPEFEYSCILLPWGW